MIFPGEYEPYSMDGKKPHLILISVSVTAEFSIYNYKYCNLDTIDY